MRQDEDDGRAGMMRRQRDAFGFSLIELLIALAILFLLVGIAVPHLLTARDRANEVSAIASLKAIHAAESLYQSNYPAKGYSKQIE
ncbi:MAG TPA: prepilin-type N-terminal cleavage/methylation domain-containing protein [Candidatus Angelobacter sp.]